MNQLHESKPTLAAEQQHGRAIFWDRPPVTPDALQKMRQSTVSQQAYVYQIKG
jgi:hypothetical protein